MVALFFTSKMCPACQKMAPVIKKLVEDGYPITIIDAKNDKKLTNKFQITAIPTLVILENDKETKRIVGVVSETEIRSVLKQSSEYHIW
jgi:thiol-disulfide isomerase/thioredoxin